MWIEPMIKRHFTHKRTFSQHPAVMAGEVSML